MMTVAARALLALQLSFFLLAGVPACSGSAPDSGTRADSATGGAPVAGSSGGVGGFGGAGTGGPSSTPGSGGNSGGRAGATDASVPDAGGAPSGDAGEASSVGGAGGRTSAGGAVRDAGRGGDAEGEADAARSSHWVGTWAAAQMTITGDANPPSPGLSGSTLRQVVHASVGGKQIRIRLDNSFGDGSVAINAVHVAISKGGNAIDTSTDRAVTFSGSSSLTLKAGAAEFSDPVDFALPPLTSMAVSIAFGKVPGTLSGHIGSKATSYLQSGNATSAASLSSAASTLHWYYLSGIDVMADGQGGSVVCIGDSTTEGDGWGDPDDVNQRWPDYLARRLQSNARTTGVGVLNEGIGSNTVLAGSWSGSVGLPLVKRFSVDALAQSGVRWIVIVEGVNDIGNCPAGKGHELATNIISAFKDIIAAAHAKGIHVYGGTIMPFGAASGYGQNNGQLNQDHIDAWTTVNDWIRASGVFDGVIDFAKALADPQRPQYVQGKYVTFDGLHPSTAGYQQMADSVDLTLFSN